MKVFVYPFIVFSLISCSLSPPIRRSGRANFRSKPSKEFAPLKKKMALLPIFNESPFGGRDLSVVATEELRREISRTQDFIVDPSASALFGTSKEIYAGGGVKLVQMSRKAKQAGVHLVLFGRIMSARVREKADEIGIVRKTKAFTENKIEIRIFDVNSKKEIFTDVIKGYADDHSYRFFMSSKKNRLKYRQGLTRYGIKVTVRKIVPKILKVSAKLDWMGRVAKIVGTKVYINAGRESGLQIGDVLKIMTEGEDVFDPETGALIGTAKGEIKGTLEITDYFGPDGTISVLHSGGSVVEGDFVMLY